MFTVAVKDHILISHSLRGEVFGPAQRMHGATYVVTTEYRRRYIDKDGIVLDTGLAQTFLGEVLAPLRHQNLDEVDELKGCNTTTEFLAQYIHEALAQRVGNIFQGHLRVVLDESPVAWASYEAPVGEEAPAT